MLIIRAMCFCGCLFAYYETNAAVIDLSGNYRCTGQDFIHHTTFDEPTTVTKQGVNYNFIWRNKTILFYGTGVLLDNTIASHFWTPSDSTQGVVIYKVLSNGDLRGRWTIKNSTLAGEEYCQKLNIVNQG